MPTKDAIRELIVECDWIYGNLNGVNGSKVVGPNGNSIFLPLPGRIDDEYDEHLEYAGLNGYYWSSTPENEDNNKAFALDLDNTYGTDYDEYYRYRGSSIRPVSD